jgi:hypothetical protein
VISVRGWSLLAVPVIPLKALCGNAHGLQVNLGIVKILWESCLGHPQSWTHHWIKLMLAFSRYLNIYNIHS